MTGRARLARPGLPLRAISGLEWGIVNENYFMEETPRPEPAAVQAALGGMYPWYEGILAAAEGFERDWKHYGRKYGWKLKLHDGDKALAEITVTPAGVLVGVAAREAEIEELREEAEKALGGPLAEALATGKAKGSWGLRLFVADEAAYGKARALLEAVAEIRRRD